MRDVLPFARFAKPVSFNGFGENNRGLALVLDGCFVSGVNLSGIVAAAIHLAKLIVSEVVHHREQLRMSAKKMFSDITAALD